MAAMFANATAYEGVMGRWSARLAPLFVDFVRVQDGGRILDVGCGTGSLVQAVAERAPRSQVVGLDSAQPFIDYCRHRFTDSRITFDCGNAMELPYPSGSFDQSLSLLVFQHIPQPARAATEMLRVTRAGGIVAACTWDRSGLETSAILREEAVKVDPAAGSRMESFGHYNRKGQLAGLWQESGFEGVEETALELQMNFSSFDDYWLPYTSGAGPNGAYVASLPSERRDALRDGLRNRLFPDRSDGPFTLRARALAVRATVPG